MSLQPHSLTLLICTSGRPGLLDRCLSAVGSQHEPPDQLVVVNGKDDETPAVVEAHAGSFADVVLVEHPNRNLATLRNLGLPFCMGSIVAMTDDDAVPRQGWSAAIRAAHGQLAQAGGIGGPVRGLSDRFLSRVADAVVFPDPRLGRPIDTLPTVNMSYKRAAIQATGEFDERLFRGEDVDYNWRLTQAGREIAFEPAMAALHQHRTTLRDFYRQQYMYGRAYVLVRSKWPSMYAVYPRSLRTARSWAKLAHTAIAVLYQPLGIARSLPSTSDQLQAYPVLVIHHLVWKFGMVRQALIEKTTKGNFVPAKEVPRVSKWHKGCKVPS